VADNEMRLSMVDRPIFEENDLVSPATVTSLYERMEKENRTVEDFKKTSQMKMYELFLMQK
jgi:hypothetical protein